MQKNLNISLLLDYYGEMLTDKQREAVEFYYNEDLSLSEIAQHFEITRQGVRDNIKRAEAVMLELEDKLGHARRFKRTQESLDVIVENVRAVERVCDQYNLPSDVMMKLRSIEEIALELGD